MQAWTLRLAVLACLLLIPVSMDAQTVAASIAGTVRDTTGAVLPGVTVEASSPALIEKVRAVVTDASGQYQIIDLRPGDYAVMFSLAGFRSVRREGIQLTTGFTATVNAELNVGSVEETITVSGASPVVDVQSTRQQTVMTRDVIDQIPTGHMYTMMAVLIPGITAGLNTGPVAQDVGGQAGQSKPAMSIHGGRYVDQQVQVDGMTMEIGSNGRQDATGNMLVQANFQEYAFDYAGNSAEVEGGGVRVNLIPKEGGNTVRSRLYLDGSWSRLQSSNLDNELRSQGLTDVSRLKEQWSLYGTVGGPIVRDRLWFFGAGTLQRNEVYVAGTYYSKDPAAWVYEPDLSRQAVYDEDVRDGAGRITWQATSVNRFSTFINRDWYCRCHHNVGQGTVPEAAIHNITPNFGDHVYQATWTSTISNRLLFEAGFSDVNNDQQFFYQPETVAPRIRDNGAGLNLRASTYSYQGHYGRSYRSSLSYVTGTHALKVGFLFVRNRVYLPSDTFGGVMYTTVNGTPTAVTYSGNPTYSDNLARNLGIFAQDQWRTGRLTVNAGLRFDHLYSWYPEHNIPATQYVLVDRVIPPGEGTNWQDVSPRIGTSFDLFGNGKTAIKGTINRYVLRASTNASSVNPINTNNADTRRWTDFNNDYTVQGNPFDPSGNLELGPTTNLNFGKPVVNARYDPEWADGFGLRPNNWEFSAGIQHEIMPGMAINASYFHRRYGNLGVEQNEEVSPSDFKQYCVTAPLDPRLPGGGGNTICGFSDVDQSKVGRQFTLLTGAEKFGGLVDHWSGFDVTMSARVTRLLLQGGVSTGKATKDQCAISKNYPNVVGTSASGAANHFDVLSSGPTISSDFCRVEFPFLTQVKLLGSYQLPWDLQFAATFQDNPGPHILANAVFTNAQILPSLGRPLSGASTVTLNIVPPGTLYGERARQLDLRLAKTLKIGPVNVQGIFDLFNALNDNSVLVLNRAYGATLGSEAGAPWQDPQATLPGRTAKFAMQVDF